MEARPLPTETVQLLNMSDPKNVKVMKTFKGVTSIYPDDGRKLVYLVNSDGLWIVSHRMTHPLPLCNSGSALTPFRIVSKIDNLCSYILMTLRLTRSVCRHVGQLL